MTHSAARTTWWHTHVWKRRDVSSGEWGGRWKSYDCSLGFWVMSLSDTAGSGGLCDSSDSCAQTSWPWRALRLRFFGGAYSNVFKRRSRMSLQSMHDKLLQWLPIQLPQRKWEVWAFWRAWIWERRTGHSIWPWVESLLHAKDRKCWIIDRMKRIMTNAGTDGVIAAEAWN